MKAVPGAVQAAASLRFADIPVRFLTSSTQGPKRVIVKKLRAFGFVLDPREILTPAAAACAWLSKNGPTAVVVRDARSTFTYDRLNAALRLIKDGAPYLALAVNRVFMDADGDLSMDAGAFVRASEY